MKELEDLFHRALAIPPSEAAEWLDRECRGNAALRREVESLLRAHRTLFTAAAAETDTAAPDAGAGSEVGLPQRSYGTYRPLRPIGRGGMSAVYLARRVGADFEQEVALKVIAPHAGD